MAVDSWRKHQLSKRNIAWLIAVLASGAVAWIAFGWLWGLIVAAIVLAVSELVERQVRRTKRAAREAAAAAADE